ncbi:hypothetical protein SAMN05421819_4065 [Bryocella elongata]|uniref:Uncharacterized protein n=1 Tax=Bryocella elongata TaxID=863522 RepID=A0A1H6BYH5_9BACT|nr:hypothetical protein [Bryocella elongata]SEG65759.1 hypothetical protein SAMN05421819_4065 [Bryocella elongata]
MRRVVRVTTRVAGWTLLTLVVVFLVLCTVGEIRQRVLVHRAKALMLDIQSLQDHKSTWADAQRLMTKWGKWGRYEGSCTAVDCMYVVKVTAYPPYNDQGPTRLEMLWFRLELLRVSPLQIGDGLMEMTGMFLVQDGVVRRKGLVLYAESSSVRTVLNLSSPDEGSSLGFIVQVSERGSLEGRGEDAYQAASHPNMAVTSHPCEGCAHVRATLASGSDADFKTISTFRFDCLTGWSPCKSLDQFVQSADLWRHENQFGWDLPGDEMYEQDPTSKCDVPLEARARDAKNIAVVEALDDSSAPYLSSELNAYSTGVLVRATSILREARSLQGRIIPLSTIGRRNTRQPGLPVSMRKGERYALLFTEWTSRQGSYGEGDLEPCEVIPWSAEAGVSISKGMALRDPIRGAEPAALIYDFVRDPLWSDHF